MTVKSTNGVPEPNSALDDLRDFTTILYEGFEAATMHARSYFEEQQKDIDPFLASALTRFKVIEYLRQRSQFVEDMQREDVANLGLRAQIGPYRVCIWKSKDDAIPFPGLSRFRRNFITQPIDIQGYLGSDFAPQWHQVRLVILWNVYANFRLDGLHLVLPKRAALKYGMLSDVHWSTPIPFPPTVIKSSDYPETSPESDISDEQMFEPLEENEEDTGQSP